MSTPSDDSPNNFTPKLALSHLADGKEILLESPNGEELPARGFDAGAETYQAPPANLVSPSAHIVNAPRHF